MQKYWEEEGIDIMLRTILLSLRTYQIFLHSDSSYSIKKVGTTARLFSV